MNLTQIYLHETIEDMQLITLKSILEGKDNNIRVRNESPAMILLNNNKIIKCVGDYYKTSTDKKRSKLKSSNECYDTQTLLEIKGVANYNCNKCHLKCITMLREKDLVLI